MLKLRRSIVADLLGQVGADIIRRHQLTKYRGGTSEDAPDSVRLDIFAKFKQCQARSRNRDNSREVAADKGKQRFVNSSGRDLFRSLGDNSSFPGQCCLPSRKLPDCLLVLSPQTFVKVIGDAFRALMEKPVALAGTGRISPTRILVGFPPMIVVSGLACSKSW